MPTTYIAADLIGQTLYAAKKIPIYSGNLKTILGYAMPGQPIGVVYSWIGGQEGKDLYWMFLGTKWPQYYVKHQLGNFDFSITKKELTISNKKSLEQHEKEVIEKAEISSKGQIMYNLEKYGGYALLAYIGVTVFKEIMETSKSK